ncbi:MAG: hypothetical protein C4B58_02865 [Deltaproteobacteria bacterium]|nr:MAG: hypothetical protein C4B58_02865 [Deltaproteobacteria bacterium]
MRRVRWPSEFQCPLCGSENQPWITHEEFPQHHTKIWWVT